MAARCGVYGRKNLLDSAVADCQKALDLARQQGAPPQRIRGYEQRLKRYQQRKERGKN